MKSGFEIRWTPHALKELADTLAYLENNFTEKELKRLARKIEETTHLISQNPELFPKSTVKNVRRVAILKFNTMYYRVINDRIEIISFFSNRQSPDKRGL